MELFEGLLSRRSIRRYTEDTITKEQVEELVKAAMHAPSSKNCQPWHFIIIDDKDVLDAFRAFHPYANMLKYADKAVLVCGDTQLQNGPGYWMVDCANATQNLLLAAHAKGIGAVWVGIYPREDRMSETVRLFELPDTIKPLALVSLGIPVKKSKEVTRFKPERIRYNKWK